MKLFEIVWDCLRYRIKVLINNYCIKGLINNYRIKVFINNYYIKVSINNYCIKVLMNLKKNFESLFCLRFCLRLFEIIWVIGNVGAMLSYGIVSYRIVSTRSYKRDHTKISYEVHSIGGRIHPLLYDLVYNRGCTIGIVRSLLYMHLRTMWLYRVFTLLYNAIVQSDCTKRVYNLNCTMSLYVGKLIC